MAKKPTAAEKKKAAEAAKAGAGRNLLAEAANARNTNTPLMATEAEMHALLMNPTGPLVEFNADMRSGDKVAFRATDLGMQTYAAQQAGQPAPGVASGGWGAPVAPAASVAPSAAPTAAPFAPTATGGRPAIQLDKGVPIPAARRGGRGQSVYNFENWDIGDAYFIPATEDNPNPAKRIASTVSSASNRLEPKKFIVRSVDEPGRGKGARIWRTA